MRTLLRNKTRFFYALLEDVSESFDEDGYLDPEPDVVYSYPRIMWGNISAAQGEVETRQFGDSELYDKVIVLDDLDTLIDEHTILWIDVEPDIDETGATATAHDYIVKQVARSINSVSIAVRKVNVRE